MSIFKDKVLLITGGTGSFGNAVLRRFLDSDIKEIRIFSRDEKKQDDMRHALQNPKVKFYIGNVRDKQSVDIAMRGVDYVFAAAALKQVPSCEFFPMEATMTNVIGTNNVLLSAIEHGALIMLRERYSDTIGMATDTNSISILILNSKGEAFHDIVALFLKCFASRQDFSYRVLNFSLITYAFLCFRSRCEELYW